MNIIIEGPDATGKTTLAQKLINKFNMTTVHSTATTRNDLTYHLDLLDYQHNVVFDRFHIGEMVFPKIYNRPGKLTFDEFMEINRRIVDNNDILIIMISSDLSILQNRLIERGELDYLKEIEAQNNAFMEWAYILNAYFDGYKNYKVVDISKLENYDKLDAWIDSVFNKNNINTVYHKICSDLIEFGMPINTRNMRGKTLELTNYLFTIDDIENTVVTLKTNPCSYTYIAGELLWYLSGRNDVEFISKFGSMWSKLSDDGKTNNSAYGYIIKHKFGFNQLDNIIDLLKKDPDTRRAVLNINYPMEMVYDTKDDVCTICLMFQIRNNKLNCTAIMRSNDVNFGLRNDLVYFLNLQKYVATCLNISCGTYTHFANSMHLYDRDYKKIKSVAFGNMETITEKFDICQLLKNKDRLIQYIDNSWQSTEAFRDELRKLKIIV